MGHNALQHRQAGSTLEFRTPAKAPAVHHSSATHACPFSSCQPTRPSSATPDCDDAWSTAAAESTTERVGRPAGRGGAPASWAGAGRAAASGAGGVWEVLEGPAGSSALRVRLGSMAGAAAAREVRIASERRQRLSNAALLGCKSLLLREQR